MPLYEPFPLPPCILRQGCMLLNYCLPQIGDVKNRIPQSRRTRACVIRARSALRNTDHIKRALVAKKRDSLLEFLLYCNLRLRYNSLVLQRNA